MKPPGKHSGRKAGKKPFYARFVKGRPPWKDRQRGERGGAAGGREERGARGRPQRDESRRGAAHGRDSRPGGGAPPPRDRRPRFEGGKPPWRDRPHGRDRGTRLEGGPAQRRSRFDDRRPRWQERDRDKRGGPSREGKPPWRGERDRAAGEGKPPWRGERDRAAGEGKPPWRGERDRAAGEGKPPWRGERDRGAGGGKPPWRGERDRGAGGGKPPWRGAREGGGAPRDRERAGGPWRGGERGPQFKASRPPWKERERGRGEERGKFGRGAARGAARGEAQARRPEREGKPPWRGKSPDKPPGKPAWRGEREPTPARRAEAGPKPPWSELRDRGEKGAGAPPRFGRDRERGGQRRPARREERDLSLSPRIEVHHQAALGGNPRLLVATEDGRFYDHPSLEALPVQPGEAPPKELGGPALFRPLPEGSRVVMLPGRKAVGWHPAEQRRVEVDTLDIEGAGRPVWAVAAVLAPAWLRLRCPAFVRLPGSPELPQWAYADAGWLGDGIAAATVRIDPHTHWDPRLYNTPDLQGIVERRLAGSPTSRILRQLAKCALEYSCTTAQNTFYGRDEGALPVSSACNAECLGCLSYRPPGGAPSSHERMPAPARTEDLVEVALEHLRRVPDGIVSFGQGCEGEPLVAADRIERAIIAIRARTQDGTLQLNTNASLPAVVGKLFTAGLDSIRVSMNSAVPAHYAAYYKPVGYTFDDVRTSIGVARGKGGFVSINLLVHPGLSDRPSEIDALVSLLNEYRVDLLQLRNLAIDPDDYLALYPEAEAPVGMGEFLRRVRSGAPSVRLGSFNLPRQEWATYSPPAASRVGD